MKILSFYITENKDNTFDVQTFHMHYAFRQDLNFYSIKPCCLYTVMAIIKRVSMLENIIPVFKLK